MPAGKYDFKIEQGATLRRTISWKDEVGNPVDLTGCTARMKLKINYKEAVAIVNLTTENGGITLDGPLGTINLHLTATQTAAITTTKGVYDIEIVHANGDVTRLLEGKVTVSLEATN